MFSNAIFRKYIVLKYHSITNKVVHGRDLGNKYHGSISAERHYGSQMINMNNK